MCHVLYTSSQEERSDIDKAEHDRQVEAIVHHQIDSGNLGSKSCSVAYTPRPAMSMHDAASPTERTVRFAQLEDPHTEVSHDASTDTPDRTTTT